MSNYLFLRSSFFLNTFGDFSVDQKKNQSDTEHANKQVFNDLFVSLKDDKHSFLLRTKTISYLNALLLKHFNEILQLHFNILLLKNLLHQPVKQLHIAVFADCTRSYDYAASIALVFDEFTVENEALELILVRINLRGGDSFHNGIQQLVHAQT